jgi:uncharacterized membrane protein (UPF0127 family)
MKLHIKDNVLNCEVKNTAEGIKTGMMGRGRIDGCMVFMLPFLGEQRFHMLNCLIPLDIIFCDDNKVTAIHKNCPPCDDDEVCESYLGYGNLAIEFKSGYCEEIGLKVGDEIKLAH